MANIKQKAIMKFKDDSFSEKFRAIVMKTGKVKINGMGIFEIRRMKERHGYGIYYKDRIVLPPFNKIVFRPTIQLRNLIQEYAND